MTNNKPIYGVTYSLTGGGSTPSIMNGNTREESRVSPKYKIRARTAWDYIEIGPFDTREEAESCIREHNHGQKYYGQTWSNELIEPIQQA